MFQFQLDPQVVSSPRLRSLLCLSPPVNVAVGCFKVRDYVWTSNISESRAITGVLLVAKTWMPRASEHATRALQVMGTVCFGPTYHRSAAPCTTNKVRKPAIETGGD